jgi:hypothetical protein
MVCCGVLFFWFEASETHKIERTWMNTHIQYEGALPMLNKVHSRRRVDHLGQDLNGRQPPLRGYGMFDGLIRVLLFTHRKFAIFA